MGFTTEFALRHCVTCGMPMEVLEARDCETGEIVPVPDDVMCGRCAMEMRPKLRLYDARDRFARAVTDWFEESCESEELFRKEQGIEDWVLDFQRYLADVLRGRRGVDPEHPVFRTRYGDE